MLNLIKNEWAKLWAKKATWIMLIITVISIIILLIGTKWIASIDDENANDWKANEQQQVQILQETLANDQLSKADLKETKQELQISQYRLDNNIAPTTFNSRNSFLENSSNLLMFTSLFTVIVAASIVAFEFGAGSIKMLLTRPIARWKILLSKLLTSVIFSITLGVITLVLSIILAYIFFSSGVNLEVINNKVVEINTLTHTLGNYSLYYGDILISLCFAFMLGSLFNSSALAIGLTLFISFFSQTLVILLSKYEFIKYFWFSVSDLNSIYAKYSLIDGVTMGFAVTILVIYAAIFIAISFIRFNKKDIKA